MTPGKIIVANIHNIPSIENRSIRYIHRPYLLGNPFIMDKCNSRHDVIDKFEKWFDIQLQYNFAIRRLMQEFEELVISGRNLILVCYCSPLACHGDIIKNRLEKLLEERMKGTNV